MAAQKTQVTLYMKARKDGKSQAESAARAGLSERTGRRIDTRKHHCQKLRKPRQYSTRKDPLGTIWDNELRPMLENQPDLLPTTLFEHLQDNYPGQYDKTLRTIQRRMKQWRALYGKEQEVMFRQIQQAGQQALVDFTVFKGITIFIAGVMLNYRLFHFRLAFSKWSYVKVIQGGESFTALAEGTTEALNRLGAVPAELRTDSLSAAFRNLTPDQANDLTERYQAFCQHYDMEPTRNNRGKGHENGAIESPHGHIKRRIQQQLQLCFSKVTDQCYHFDTLDEFQAFIDAVVAKLNRRNDALLREELAVMAPLPATAGVDFTEARVKVTSTSTINVRHVVYSVPSRLIAERLCVRLYDDRLECYLGSTHAVTLKRLHVGRQQRGRQIDYRHLIASLARKPMAFFHASLRDDILPNDHWRQLWQKSCQVLPPRQACYLVVGALELAATHDNEVHVACALEALLVEKSEPSLLVLQKRLGLEGSRLPAPVGDTEQHDLASYDALLKNQESNHE